MDLRRWNLAEKAGAGGGGGADFELLVSNNVFGYRRSNKAALRMAKE
jgi:hypothetical protein